MSMFNGCSSALDVALLFQSGYIVGELDRDSLLRQYVKGIIPLHLFI